MSASDASLKVQTSDDGEPVVVARSDAYRVPSPKHRFAPGDPAICRERPARWQPCRIVTVENLVASLGPGEERPIEEGQVLLPSPVTALNIQRYFEDLYSRTRFVEAALLAGQPVRPSGWTPEPHEPVLARRRADWFSAHALHLLEDGGVRVSWDGNEHPEPLPGAYVVPVPPFAHTFARGDFALIRPTTPAEPWKRVRIEGLGPDEAVVVGEDGQRRRVESRGLVPLSGGS